MKAKIIDGLKTIEISVKSTFLIHFNATILHVVFIMSYTFVRKMKSFSIRQIVTFNANCYQ